MAVIRDVMPAFELFQPTSVDARAGAARSTRLRAPGCWPAASTASTGSRTASSVRSVVVDLSGIAELKGVRPKGDGLEIGAMTTLTEVVRHPVVQRALQHPDEGGRSGRVAADPQPGNDRRQRVAGHALLVLPRRLVVLSRRRQHLLRRHADGDQSRARHPRRRPLRRRQPVGHGACADRAAGARW